MTVRPARVLAVWCPDWPVVAMGGDPDLPVAVLEQGRVAACSAAARALGVRRGQRLRDAQRYCPALTTHHRDMAREARVFEPVVTAVESYAPALEVVRPGVCVVEVRGPARYFGGELALARTVRDAVADLTPATEDSGTQLRLGLEEPPSGGLGVGVGVADGVFAALLAARSDAIVPRGETPAFLAPWPVAVLERPELARVLATLGVATLGQFAALPREQVSARFGADGVIAHRLAGGRSPRPLAPRRPTADLSAAMSFDPPVGRSDQLVFAAKTLAERMHSRLAEAGLACVRVAVVVTTSEGEESRRLWRHDGLLSAAAVAERVRWQLDGWRRGTDAAGETDEARQGATGVVTLRLVPDQLVLDHGRQLGLWGEDLVPGRVSRAVDRVRALCGDATGYRAVTRPILTGGRDPAASVNLVPWGDPPPERAPDGTWPGRIPDPPPSAVFADPPLVEVLDADGLPVTVDARNVISAPPRLLARLVGRDAPDRPLRVVGWAGPWPVQERWWDPTRRRDRVYLQCLTEEGTAWLLALQAEAASRPGFSGAGGWRLAARYG